MPLVFVYGTLMLGGCRSSVIAEESFIGDAVTEPGYRLYDCGRYPGLVECDGVGRSIRGELWRMSDACLARLDKIEGVDEGLYDRRPIRLMAPTIGETCEAYFYRLDTTGMPDVGDRWENETHRESAE